MKEIKQNVLDFNRRCSEIIGSYESDWFNIGNYNYFEENPIDSPIEQIFYCAFKTLCRINLLDWQFPCHDREGNQYLLGIGIFPQQKIGNYRVDFIASNYPKRGENHEVVVECDSQIYHERNEKERRYEKKRDRFIQSQGYKVFRFTGSEIVKDPFLCASETIASITKKDAIELSESIINYDSYG